MALVTDLSNTIFMRLFKNKVLLRWREPMSYLQYVKKHMTWKQWLRAYIRPFTQTFLFVMVFWVFTRLVRQDGEVISWLAVGVAVGAGLFVCIAGWLTSFFRPEILVREKDIVKISAGRSVSLSYKEMQRCVVRGINLDDRSIHILEIRMNNGSEWEFEIAPEIAQQNIKGLLEQKGVGVVMAGV